MNTTIKIRLYAFQLVASLFFRFSFIWTGHLLRPVLFIFCSLLLLSFLQLLIKCIHCHFYPELQNDINISVKSLFKKLFRGYYCIYLHVYIISKMEDINLIYLQPRIQPPRCLYLCKICNIFFVDCLPFFNSNMYCSHSILNVDLQ